MTPMTVSLRQAGEILGFSAKTIGRMVARRELSYIPLGPSGVHKRIPVADLKAWQEKHTIRTVEDEKRIMDRRGAYMKGRAVYGGAQDVVGASAQ